jgi:predicted Fe-S protein YdhL (DUF1289 family)
MVQLHLSLGDPRPRPETVVWEALDARQRKAVIALLARLIAKAAAAASKENDHDRIR